MKDFAITAQRNIDRATHQLHALERYAERRDQLLGTLDLGSLEPTQLCRIFGEDEEISEALAWGQLYIAHLAQMEALGLSLSTQIPLAA
ncbi:hypothetical protein [Novosphingobium sp. HII-3]|uniref:hypothetical protein n=1 Tax=Novosphingobium sp. HII-3 TaxID=2075565 RepID=UPI000CDA96D9|nr:hypothetical protein [Novosphingobium sp. HII-3]